MSHVPINYWCPILPGPSLDEVKSYFDTQHLSSEEGELFFFYYKTLGRRNVIGSHLIDWQSAASSWISNLAH